MYIYIYVSVCARMGEHLLLGGCVVYYKPCALSNLVVSISFVFPRIMPHPKPSTLLGGGVVYLAEAYVVPTQGLVQELNAV